MINTIITINIQQILDNIGVMADLRTALKGEVGLSSIDATDTPVLIKLLQDGGDEVAGLMSGYFNDEMKEFEVPVEVIDTGVVPTEGGYTYDATAGTITYVLNMPNTFNVKNVDALMRNIKGALENYVLSEYYRSRNFDNFRYEKNYRDERSKISGILSSRTEVIKRNVKTF